jgi:hypothetical protein
MRMLSDSLHDADVERLTIGTDRASAQHEPSDQRPGYVLMTADLTAEPVDQVGHWRTIANYADFGTFSGGRRWTILDCLQRTVNP